MEGFRLNGLGERNQSGEGVAALLHDLRVGFPLSGLRVYYPKIICETLQVEEPSGILIQNYAGIECTKRKADAGFPGDDLFRIPSHD